MQIIYIISVVIHIMAAVSWIGGALFLAFIIFPSMRSPELKVQRGQIVRLIGKRLRVSGWIAFALLSITGCFNIVFRFGTEAIMMKSFWIQGAGLMLALKLILFSFIIAISLYHDFVVGPKSTAASKENPGSPKAIALRKQAAFHGRINILLGIIVLILAVIIVRGI